MYYLFKKKSLQYFFISSPVETAPIEIGAGSSTFVTLSPRVALILNKLIEIRGALVSEELLFAVACSIRPKRIELHPQKCILHWNFLVCIFLVLSIVLHKSSLISYIATPVEKQLLHALGQQHIPYKP
jgi:hypothetical protein